VTKTLFRGTLERAFRAGIGIGIAGLQAIEGDNFLIFRREMHKFFPPRVVLAGNGNSCGSRCITQLCKASAFQLMCPSVGPTMTLGS
jgi:hypothetical protein